MKSMVKQGSFTVAPLATERSFADFVRASGLQGKSDSVAFSSGLKVAPPARNRGLAPSAVFGVVTSKDLQLRVACCTLCGGSVNMPYTSVGRGVLAPACVFVTLNYVLRFEWIVDKNSFRVSKAVEQELLLR